MLETSSATGTRIRGSALVKHPKKDFPMSHRLSLAVLVAAFLPALCPGNAEAQLGVAAEGRLGVTVPLGQLSDDDQDPGVGGGAEVFLNLNPTFGLYLAGSRHSFQCASTCLLGETPRSTGMSAGIKLTIPSPADALLWMRAGLSGRRFSGGGAPPETHLGYELGAGIDMLIGRQIYVVPHLGYTSHDAHEGLRASYLTFGAGLHYRLR